MTFPIRAISLLLLLALLALAGVASAGATERKIIGMPLNSTLLLAGSKVACGSGVKGGNGFIDCGITGSDGQPKRGSYFVLMTDGGRVNVIAASTRKIIFSRLAASRERPSQRTLITQTAHAGDQIVLPTMTQISCQVVSAGGQATIICYYVDKKTGIVRPRSFSFGLSNTVTTVLSWNAAKKEHLVGNWPENG
jgi:hypothetical protein